MHTRQAALCGQPAGMRDRYGQKKAGQYGLTTQ